MNPITTAITYELQETGNDVVIAKLAGFLQQALRPHGYDDATIALELRHYFRNSDKTGRRNPVYHHSLY